MDVFRNTSILRIKSFLKRFNLLHFLLGLVDLFAIVCSFQCAYLISDSGNDGFFFNEKYLLYLLICILPFWILILYLIKFTQIPTKRYKVLFFLYLNSAIMIMIILFILHAVINLSTVPNLFFVAVAFLGIFFLFIVRISEYFVFKNYGVKRHIHLNIVIIADDSSIPFIEDLLSKKELGYKVVVIFTESTIIKDKYEKTTIILPGKYLGILNDLIEVDLIDEVLFLKDKLDAAEVRATLSSCEELGITFRLRHNNSIITLSSAVKTSFADENFLSFINIPNYSYSLAIKKTLDINMALVMIVILSPVLLLISLLIKLTSHGPVISKMEWIGQRGRSIYLYRFRTINVSESQDSANMESKKKMDRIELKIVKTTPVTKFGKLLLKTGLDQLPLLFNILKGDISVIIPSLPLQSYNMQHSHKLRENK
jgi:lipopolysaccharide/colanic/teichoic acid biosynthesis glycosyltransferase